MSWNFQVRVRNEIVDAVLPIIYKKEHDTLLYIYVYALI